MWFVGFWGFTTDRIRIAGGPSWPTFLGHMKDSLWSVDFLRCESVVLQTYWVLVVMDQYTRRIIGFGNSSRNRRWSGSLPHIQSGDSRPGLAKICEFR